MKTFQWVGYAVNSLAGLYFLYMAAMHFYVYWQNRSMGHEESARSWLLNLVIFLLLLGFSAAAFWLHRYTGQQRLGNFFLFLPLGLVGLYLLWAIFLLISSGGKWN